ncbi:MAG: hypothetical protein ACYC2H_01580 [Thermoplasmatota archaeon]
MVFTIAVACWTAAVLAYALVLVLLRTGGWQKNWLLVAILAIEGTLQLIVGAGEFLGSDDERGVALFMPAMLGLAALAWTYLLFVARLDTPIVRFARNRPVQVIAGVALLAAAAAVNFAGFASVLQGRTLDGTEGDAAYLVVAVLFIFAATVLVSLLALVASLHAWLRAEKGTPARARAGAFALAFGMRDVLLAGGVAASEVAQAAGPLEGPLDAFGDAGLPLATIAFVPLLTYGILRTQLFDIDLKVKLGIKRSTAVTIALVVVLGAAKTAEFYLNKTYGLLAGGVAAGAMLVLTPRLNKMGDKVANAALPQVQPTNAYLSFKKLEVYRAAVESANEVGLDEKQRAVLERLRAKLGLAPGDAAAIEAELAPAIAS